MFRAFRVAKARAHCVEALRLFVVRPSVFGPWPPEFWRDPFVLGFLMFAIGTLSKIATGGKLRVKDLGFVFNGTIEDLGGDPIDCSNRIESLSRERDPDFLLGGRNAETIIVFNYNLRPMTDDADVAAATRLARGMALTENVGRAEIGGALLLMLFTQVVKRRLELRS